MQGPFQRAEFRRGEANLVSCAARRRLRGAVFVAWPPPYKIVDPVYGTGSDLPPWRDTGSEGSVRSLEAGEGGRLGPPPHRPTDTGHGAAVNEAEQHTTSGASPSSPLQPRAPRFFARWTTRRGSHGAPHLVGHRPGRSWKQASERPRPGRLLFAHCDHTEHRCRACARPRSAYAPPAIWAVALVAKSEGVGGCGRARAPLG